MNKKLFTLITIFIVILSTLFSFDAKAQVKPQEKGIVDKAVDGVIDTIAPDGSLLATLIPSKKNCNFVDDKLYQPFSDIDEKFPGASTLGLVKSKKDPSVTCIKVEGGTEALLKMLFTVAISIIIILAVINISISGIQYMTQEAVGKKGEAKKRLQNSLIALALGLMSYAILYTVNKQLVSFEFNPSGLDVDGSIDRGIASANRDVGTYSTAVNTKTVFGGIDIITKNTQNSILTSTSTGNSTFMGEFNSTGAWNETVTESWVRGLRNGERSTDGRLVVSVYSASKDSITDTNTSQKRGNRNNLLREGSVALSPDLIRKYSPQTGQEIFINGTSIGFYEDATAETYNGVTFNNTVDIYDENGSIGGSYLKNISPGQWTISFGKTRPQITNN